MGGTGNQLYQYAAGRRLAHKLKTELKLDLTFYEHDNLRPYSLNLFNIKESIATPEEISAMKKVMEPQPDIFVPEVLNCPDNVWLHGYWSYEDYFSDITDILRRELTLKNSLTPTSAAIIACPVLKRWTSLDICLYFLNITMIKKKLLHIDICVD